MPSPIPFGPRRSLYREIPPQLLTFMNDLQILMLRTPCMAGAVINVVHALSQEIDLRD